MKIFCIYCFTLFALFLFYECSTNTKDYESASVWQKNYNLSDFSMFDSLKGKSVKLHEPMKIRRIDHLESYLIFISEISKSNNLISLYNKSDLEMCYSLGKKGMGPGELLTPVSIDVSLNRNQFIIHDGTKKLGFIYPIDSIINTGGDFFPKDQNVVSLPNLFCYDIFFLNEKNFLTTSFHKRKQFIKFRKEGDILSTFGNYPDIEIANNQPEEIYGQVFQGVYAKRPDNKFLVQALMTFNYINIYENFGNNNVTRIKIHDNHDFDSDKKPTGYKFLSVVATDSLFYSLYANRPFKSNRIVNLQPNLDRLV